MTFSKRVVAVGATALALALYTAPVEAACPNACSGHGTCGEFDSCSCYANWEGGDCSLRTCPHYFSWITTSKGDVNYDGDTNDATIYDGDHYFTTGGVDYLKSQQFPGGDWEKWPSTINPLSKDEGHYYMECANRGVCDRSNGICKCFDGYTGGACRRAACPNDCSGHGTCKTINQQKGATAYTLWDGDMGRSCVCDAGYDGPSCQDRVCAVGDDPLTTGQHNEVQWIDVYSDFSGTLGTLWDFAGTIRLTYTDYKGDQWTTDAVTVSPYAGVATDMAADLEAALNNLPGDVLSGVTVTEGWCERPIPGTFDSIATNIATGTLHGSGYDTSNKIIRCPGSTLYEKVPLRHVAGTSIEDDTAAITNFEVLTNQVCHELDHYYCTRFKVEFTATPGDLTQLTVDTSEVTILTKTTEQGATSIGATVLDELPAASNGATGGIAVSFTHPSQNSLTCAQSNGCQTTGTTITWDANGENFAPGMEIQVVCDTTNIGTFTVSASTATSITTTQTMPDCNLGDTVGITLTQTNHVLFANADLRTILSAGDQLNIQTFSGLTTVSSVTWDHTLTANPGKIILASAHEGDDANSGETVTDPTLSHTVNVYGKGTTESSTCSDRGVCDTETGLCKCFKGYTGGACSTQNALSG